MGSFISLESASAVGSGVERQLSRATAHHTMIVWLFGGPTSCVVQLEGSHDGDNWTRIANVQIGGETRDGMVTTPTTGHIMSWVRSNLVELEGGESPTVIASIASEDDE